MDEVYIIIQVIGDLETVVDKAYWYWTSADTKAAELTKESHSKGYIDIKHKLKTLKIVGLK